MNKFKAINIISFALVVYYLGGFCTFVFVNSHKSVEYRYSENEPKLDFSFLDEVNEDSSKECKEINQKYGTMFDCATTPSSDLRVPYNKLPLNEKIEATLNVFFKTAAGLFGLDFWSFGGIHIFLTMCALAPLVLLAGWLSLWKFYRYLLLETKDKTPTQPHYRMILGVFAGVVALLMISVVIASMQDRHGSQVTLTNGRVESYRDTVRSLLN